MSDKSSYRGNLAHPVCIRFRIFVKTLDAMHHFPCGVYGVLVRETASVASENKC